MKKIVIILSFILYPLSFIHAQGYGMCWNKSGNTFYNGQFFGTTNNRGFGERTNNRQVLYTDSLGNKRFYNKTTFDSTIIFGSNAATVRPLLKTGTTKLLSNYRPSGGANLFLGENSGNFTLAGQWGDNLNTGIGDNTLSSLTNGEINVAIGHNALNKCTQGNSNIAISGNGSLYNITTGSSNIGIGRLAGLGIITGSYNIGIGDASMAGTGATRSYNIAVGRASGRNIRDGVYNLDIGARNDNASGISLVSNDSCIMIGNYITPIDSTTNALMNIGNTLYATGVNRAAESTMAAFGGQPVTSAKLSIISTTQGFLPPVVTTAQKAAIATPTEGLIVYDITLHKLCVWTGAAWETIPSI